VRANRFISSVLSCILSVLLAANTLATEAAAAPKLRIIVVEGFGATNNLRQRTAREPVVEVVDENNRPVSGALVTFLLPDRGPSGLFADGQTRLSVLTDQSGRAAARGMAPNNLTGAFKISIEASHLGETATASLVQSNIAGASVGLSGKLLALIAVGGGVAAGAAVALSRGRSSTGTGITARPAETSIVAGRPAVGGPQ
jgi:hypothetical protein